LSSVRKETRNPTSNPTSEPPRKPSTSVTETRNPTTKRTSEPPGKPSAGVRKETRNPTSDPISESPGKPSTSARKQTSSNPTQFDKHYGARIIGKAIEEYCSVQNVSKSHRQSEEMKEFTNERTSYPRTNQTSNPQ
jgi:hypothetical protein